jgi:hypothetical protein
MTATSETTPPRAYKGFTVRMGVYAIRHLGTGRTLLSWSRHLQAALNRHRFSLDTGSHRNAELQAEWRREGAAAFTFEVVDELAADPKQPATYDYGDDLASLAQLWRDRLGLTAANSYTAEEYAR